MPLYAPKLSFLAITLFLLALFAIAIAPEPPAKLLTSQEGWDVRGASSSLVSLSAFSEPFSQLRYSVVESPGGVLFRTWTPDRGIVPIEVTSAPFRPTRYMSVAITGTNRTRGEYVHAFIECESNRQKLEILKGSVNSNIAEAIVVSPDGWCPSAARLKFSSMENDVYVGAGAVFEISRLSYVKSSFLGRLPHLIISLAIFALIMFAGASLVRLFGCHNDLLTACFAHRGVYLRKFR